MKEGVKLRHGHGTYFDAEQENKYVGEWADDKMNGRGTFRYATKATYEVRTTLAGGLREDLIACWADQAHFSSICAVRAVDVLDPS